MLLLILFLLHFFPHSVTEGCVLFFGNWQLRAVVECNGKTPDIPDMLRINKIALVTAKEEMTVLFFQLCNCGHHLNHVIGSVKNTVLSPMCRFDVDDRVRKNKVIRLVKTMKMYPLPRIDGLSFLAVYFLEIFRIDGIVIVLFVRVGYIAHKDKRFLHPLAALIIQNAFAPRQYRSLMKTDIVVVRIMSRDDIGQYYNTEGVI